MRSASFIPVLHTPHMPQSVGRRAYWAATIGIGVLALWLASFYAPVEASMGMVQKVVYLHIPAAAAALLAATSAFGASLAYIWTRARVWDRVSFAASKVVVYSTLVVLATGMVWGKSEWGSWWTWSPKLTFTLILCVLYAALLVIRLPVGRPRRAMAYAVCSVIAFLDAPLVYLSVNLLPDIHPNSLPLTSEMRLTLGVCLVFALLASAGFIAGTFGMSRESIDATERLG